MIIDLTASYSRVGERIYVGQIVKATEMSERRVREVVNQLEAAGCIRRIKSKGGTASWYDLASPEVVPPREQHSGSSPRPLGGTATLPSAGPSTEKVVREDGGEYEPLAFRQIVASVRGAPVRGSQRDEWLSAYGENPAGFRAVAESAAREGHKPAALLTIKVRAGEHRVAEDTRQWGLEVHRPDSDDAERLGPFDRGAAEARQEELLANGYDVFLRVWSPT